MEETPDLSTLTPKEIEKMANRLIYGSGIDERKAEYPVLHWRKLLKIRRTEVPVPYEDLVRIVSGEHFDWTVLRKHQQWI